MESLDQKNLKSAARYCYCYCWQPVHQATIPGRDRLSGAETTEEEGGGRKSSSRQRD